MNSSKSCKRQSVMLVYPFGSERATEQQRTWGLTSTMVSLCSETTAYHCNTSRPLVAQDTKSYSTSGALILSSPEKPFSEVILHILHLHAPSNMRQCLTDSGLEGDVEVDITPVLVYGHDFCASCRNTIESNAKQRHVTLSSVCMTALAGSACGVGFPSYISSRLCYNSVPISQTRGCDS